MSRKVAMGMGTVRGWRGALLSRALLSRALLGSAVVLAAACGDDFTPATTGGAAGGGSAECTAGAVGDCYGGAEGTEGVGTCKAGTRTCGSDGAWGACEGAVEPVPETCATPEDEDCDGETNEEGEGCDCVPAASEPCYTGAEGTEGVGPCVGGTRTCGSDGKWGACDGEIVPGVEDCDAGLVDEDCDGELNEDGAACVCTISSSQDCYSGDVATKDVGNCKHGTEACNAIGTAYEACMGEVLPATEDCYVKGDEDCNGNPCSDAIFNVAAGGTSTSAVAISDVAFDSKGDLVIVGSFIGQVTFGSKTLVSPTNSAAFIAKFDKTGAVLWSSHTGGAGNESYSAVAIGAADQIFAAGTFTASFSDGSVALTIGSAAQAGMVVPYDPAGVPSTAKAFSQGNLVTEVVEVADIAVSPVTKIVTVVGAFSGQYYVGDAGKTNYGKGSFYRAFDSQLSPQGTPGTWDALGDQRLTSVAHDGTGQLILGGIYDTSINVGPTGTAGSAQKEAFVASVSKNWLRKFSTTATTVTVATAGNGDIGVGVSFTGSATVGGKTLTSMGLSDVLVAVFDNAGNSKFAASYGDGMNQATGPVAFDAASMLYVSGAYAGTIDFGGKPMPTNAPVAGFLAKMDWAKNKLDWSKSMAPTGGGLAWFGLSLAPDGRVALGGNFNGSVDLGLGALPAKGLSPAYDGVVAVFNP